MAFVRCPDCKRSLRDHIQLCPSCGYPICTIEQPAPTTLEPVARKPLIGWAVIVALLYASIHLSFLYYASQHRLDPGVFIFVGVMMLCQISLLKVPVQIERRRPIKRTALWIPIVMSGFFAGVTLLGFAFTISDLTNTFSMVNGEWLFWLACSLAALTWVYWSIVFWRMSRTTAPATVVATQNRILLKGSILEFLVAVPTFIIARQRDECCAGFESAIGIWLGLSVALVAFGPSLFFLYAAKWRKLRRL